MSPLSSYPQHTYLRRAPRLFVPLCGQPDPDKKQEADITLFQLLGRRVILPKVPPCKATYFLRRRTMGRQAGGQSGWGLAVTTH